MHVCTNWACAPRQCNGLVWWPVLYLAGCTGCVCVHFHPNLLILSAPLRPNPSLPISPTCRHHDAAGAAGVLIVSGCGFDSVPADAGVLFAADTLAAAGAVCTQVESYLTVRGGPAGSEWSRT